MTENHSTDRALFRGDMLHVASALEPESFRLVYLDPPFLSGRERIGSKKEYVYDDRWRGDMDSYLPWLEERLKAIYPLLLPDGSFVLHLDWRAAHYAKVMLDGIFGPKKFINEIIWHYTGGGRSKKRFSCKHDSLLWYSRSTDPYFDIDAVRVPYKETSGYARGGITSANGQKYRPNPLGTPVDDVWDIPIINPMSSERVGYPTQKPKALLNRVLGALSKPGDKIADLCCGSGTSVVCAEQMNRLWVGADQSEAAIACVLSRLKNECGLAITPQNVVI